MPRKKMKHSIILEEITRKSTLKKKASSLFKKAKELSILCDIDIGIIISSPHENNAIAWPCQELVKERLMRFLNTPELERMKKMVTQENYLSDRVKSQVEHMRRREKMNDAKSSDQFIQQFVKGKDLNELDVTELSSFYSFVADKLKMLEIRNKELDEQYQFSTAMGHLNQDESLIPTVLDIQDNGVIGGKNEIELASNDFAGSDAGKRC